ncbi:MAR-binding filament-like protein 1 [Nicotiana tomentosiformis]|uniref:MAR-binding filament-like protein 1 n=1 Tax=Nicotiana tomentosiformis TaxID=4098 RepID=UPI00388C7356
MAKTSKTVPQKEVASSTRPAGGEDAADPRPEEFVPEKAETILSRAELVEGEIECRTSRAVEDMSRDELGIVDISGSPQISDAMIREANMLEGRSYEGIQELTDIHDFLDGLESAASEEVIRFGELPIPNKSSWLRCCITRLSSEFERIIRPRFESLLRRVTLYKLLSEKLRADLETTRDEHEEMAEQVFRILHDSEDELEITTNNPILQVRQRLEQIEQLNSQVDELMAEGEKFKENIDTLASKKEVVQAQLESAEALLWAAKENASVQIERVKELKSRLDLATSDKASLDNELEVARSEVTAANKRADAKVAQLRIDVEARREALEEVSAQGFDVEAEIETAKAEENRAQRLTFPEEDFYSSSKSEGGKDPEGATSDEDQAI